MAHVTAPKPTLSLFSRKPTPYLDYLEAQGFDRRKAKRVLESYRGDAKKALGKLVHDTHACDDTGKPLDDYAYVAGCAICDVRAGTDAAVIAERDHDPTHIFYDHETNSIKYREDCDICQRRSTQNVDRAGAKNTWEMGVGAPGGTTMYLG